MPKRVRCSNCGYLCLENISNVFLGDRTLVDADPLRGFDAVRSSEYDKRVDYLEITPQDRGDIARLQKSAQNIYCYRHASVLGEEVQSSTEKELSVKVVAVIEKQRECKYHVHYVSGYNPTQHLMKWENEQREKSNRKWNLFYLLVGAMITFIITLVIQYFSK
ncbi:hypothetical protein ACFLW1_02655 [Chloroflexota bacterium]